MATSPETYLTVRQHADGLARELYPRAWHKHRDEPLDQLFPAIWLDQFADEAAQCLFFLPEDVKKHKSGRWTIPDRLPVRYLLWGLLGKGTYWVPDAVKSARENEHLWQEMADLPWEDYNTEWRRGRIEQIVILGSAFKKWKAQYWTGGRERPGRKPGSGSYDDADNRLLDKMHKLLTKGAATSPWNAATKVAYKAKGGAKLENKAHRLRRKYQARFHPS